MLLEVADATDRYGMGFVHRLGTPIKWDKTTLVTKVTARAGAPKQATQRLIQDVIEHPEWFQLGARQRTWVRTVHRLLDDALDDFLKAGGDIKLLEFPEGGHYFPHRFLGKDGVEKVRRMSLEATRIGGKRTFQLPRYYETMADAVNAGLMSEGDIIGQLEQHLRSMRVATADLQYVTSLYSKGVPVGSLIPAEVMEAPGRASALYEQSRRALTTIHAQAQHPNAIVGRMPAKGNPLRRYVEEARDVVKQLQKGEMTKKEARAALREVRDTAEAVTDTLRGERIKAAKALEARKVTVRDAMIAKDGTAVPSSAFKESFEAGSFPEDSIAIGRFSSPKWPQLTDVLFPDDILREVDKYVGDRGEAWLKAAQRISEVPRTMGAGADLNFPFIQGILELVRHPVAWSKAVYNSFRTLGNPTQGVNYLIRQAEKYPQEWADYLRYVRQMGEQEWFQAARRGGILAEIPGVREFYGRMGLSFDTFLDVGRWEWWKAVYTSSTRERSLPVRALQAAINVPTRGPRNIYELEQLGAVVRNAMGTTGMRGLGIGLTQRQFENGIAFFAARYTRSAFALMSDAMSGGIRGAEARRALGSLLAGGSIIYTGICLSLGQKPNFNPTEPGFMSVRVGDNYVGLPGIFRSMMKTIGYSIAAAKDDPTVFFDPRRVLENPAFRFWRSRAAPTSSKFLDIATGRDFIGRPTRADWDDLLPLVRSAFTPFFVETMLEANGSLSTKAKVVLGEFFLGRSVPISPYQLRNEAVYKWAQENGVTLHDLEGKEFTPGEYGQLTKALRAEFDKAQPSYTGRVEDWRQENARAWAALDELSAKTASRLTDAGKQFTEPTSEHYGDGEWYRQVRATILSQDREEREDFFKANPIELKPKTQEQKWVNDYMTEVVEASIDPVTLEPDWELQEELDRVWRRDHPEEAGDVLDREYATSDDPTDREFRADRLLLQPYYEFLDSMWCSEGIEEAGGLPPLTGNRSPLDFRSVGEYNMALRTDIYQSIMSEGQIPANLRGIKTSSAKDAPTLGERFSPDRRTGRLSTTQAKEAANTLAYFFMRDFYEFRSGVRTEYLKEHSEYLVPLLRWDYVTDVPEDLEPYLP